MDPGVAEDRSADPRERRQTRRKTTYVIVASVAVAVLGALAIIELGARGTGALTQATVADYRAERLSDGRLAPAFTLPRLGGGEPIALGDYRGRIVVLNFWASWCAPCRKEAPDLQAAFLDYRYQGVAFLGVDERDNDAAGLAFASEFKITYPSVADPSGKLGFDYELPGLPATLVIGRDGRIVYRFVGYLDGPTLRSALDDVLAERPA